VWETPGLFCTLLVLVDGGESHVEIELGEENPSIELYASIRSWSLDEVLPGDVGVEGMREFEAWMSC
jgi:hypothetical protein